MTSMKKVFLCGGVIAVGILIGLMVLVAMLPRHEHPRFPVVEKPTPAEKEPEPYQRIEIEPVVSKLITRV